MYYSNRRKGNDTTVVQAVCAVVFAVLSLFWLYFFQADVIAVGQHVYSNGTTIYRDGVGAIVITAVLLLLQRLMVLLVKLRKRSHALTYLPSILVLAVLGDYNETTGGIDHKWFWLAPLVLFLWGGTVWFVRKVLPFPWSNERFGFFSRSMWTNIVVMMVMMFFMTLSTNTNAVLHFRAYAERSILKGNLDDALRAGNRSLETDRNLTMVRAFALSLKGQLGERLFEYPVEGSSQSLLPLWGQSTALILSPDTFCNHLGQKAVQASTLYSYCDSLENDSMANAAVADYRLCGLLIDKKLDLFAHYIKRYYPDMTKLPKHYREALTLYRHRRSETIVDFNDDVMEEDWKNFVELEKAYPNPMERKGKMLERYSMSYWFYYFYS